MPRVDPAWIIKKGSENCTLTDRIRLSPAPKLGGWAGKYLRFLSVSRGRSILTDVQPGSLAVQRRVIDLPSMQQMWFSRQGHSLGYTKPRGAPGASELFFFDPEARLCVQRRLPAAVVEAISGNEQWFVACRDGRVYAFSLDGWPQWNELIPNRRRDQATNEQWGLPVFHPRLHLAAESPVLVIGAEQEIHRYSSSGEHLWGNALPSQKRRECRIQVGDLPTRQARLSRLGLARTTAEDRVRTGYVRLSLDTLLNAGWLKQVEVDDIEDADAGEDRCQSSSSVAIGLSCIELGVSVIRASWNGIAVGTHDGLVHVFDQEGSLQRTFQVGDEAVADLLVTPAGLRAAYCASRLTLFDTGRITATTEMPGYSGELCDCEGDVLAWQSKSVWLVESSGRVRLVAETDRPIRGVWAHSGGFHVLAGELVSFRLRRI